ncbi:MarR family winged helix-turn-helix transcriptional regulator [Glaciibacter sp. 2TAF33]|uniref:MarR family winged helix-turn-helix transcriptional regulator n=1 Tax=Glaciibacter sp. 2TAF33 TaxID=3233015 RepID=UPI003F8DD5A2
MADRLTDLPTGSAHRDLATGLSVELESPALRSTSGQHVVDCLLYTEMVIADSSIAWEFRQALRLTNRRLNEEKKLPVNQLQALALLDRHSSITAAELARFERVTPPAITAMIRTMEAEGWIERTSDPKDRRRIQIEITESGRQRLTEETTSAQGWLESAIAEELDDSERETLAAATVLLRRILQHKDE